MRQSLLTPSGVFDRSAIMRRAHGRRKFWAAHGDEKTWSECLSDAWAVAKKERADAVVIANAARAFAGPNYFANRRSIMDAAIAAMQTGRTRERRV